MHTSESSSFSTVQSIKLKKYKHIPFALHETFASTEPRKLTEEQMLKVIYCFQLHILDCSMLHYCILLQCLQNIYPRQLTLCK